MAVAILDPAVAAAAAEAVIVKAVDGGRAEAALVILADWPDSIQFSFIYIAPNYNNCHLKAIK